MEWKVSLQVLQTVDEQLMEYNKKIDGLAYELSKIIYVYSEYTDGSNTQEIRENLKDIQNELQIILEKSMEFQSGLGEIRCLYDIRDKDVQKLFLK